MDQVEISNKEEILEYFKTDRDQTMRIVELTLPSFTEHHGTNRTGISFLIVDLDLNDFADEKKKGKAVLERVLNETLQKTRESIGGNPTVLWTGNGYHVYQPVSGYI